jgi:hypothetical protein
MLYYKYAPLVTVTVRHSFYTDALSRDFAFVPLPGTEVLLEAYGLVTRATQGILSIYQQQEKNSLPVQPVDRLTDLFFAMQVKTDILNITERFGSGRYFFSNLRSGGSYENKLTEAAQLGSDDAVSGFTKLATSLSFARGTLTKISLKKSIPVSGLVNVRSYTIGPEATGQLIEAGQPGLYFIEKERAAGGREVTKLVLHNELDAAGGFWSLLHLQLVPGTGRQDYVIELQPLSTTWQYLLVESESRPVHLTASSLAFTYTQNASRYPASLPFTLKAPGTYAPALAKHIDAIKADKNIKEVHVFESGVPVQLMEGALPGIAVSHGTEVLARNIAVPDRTMKETKILYKL